MIRNAKYILDSRYLLLLYNSLILPFFTYCIQTWGNNYQTKFSKLISLQKKAIRVIDHADWNDHTSPLFRKHNLLKFPDLVKYANINVMHNYLCHKLPIPIADRFALDEHTPRRFVRPNCHFAVPFASTNYCKFSLFVSAPSQWNDCIATKIRNLDDVPRNKLFFKKVVKKLFTENY